MGEALRELELRDTWVVSSPRRRAIQTAELAGLTIDEVSPLLAEWDYGDYEVTGITGARTWCGHGVFAHNLVKIGTLAA